MTNRSLRILAVCAALGAPALTSTLPARAQAAQQSDAAALAQSRELFQKGNKLYDEGKYPQAEDLYLRAWRLKKSYDLAGNLGNLEADMNKPRAAAEYLSYAVREFPAGGRPSLRDALLKRLGEVQKLVGTLRFTVNKPGAEVLLDGHAVGLSPLPHELYVEPGTHSVEARLEGYPPVTATVTVLKGKAEQVALTLMPPAGPNKMVIGIGAGIAGAGVIAGAVLLGVGASKGGTISDLQAKIKASGGCASATAAGDCADLRSAGSSKATLSNAGLWTLVGGGVVGIGTLVYGLVGGSRAARTGMSVVPVVTADGGGLWAKGAF
jgi:hypothetical protein